ncbi:hypothetical protein [uncultured Croceitalea sp.]|uniref:hypothetical protein n=1 Tax=uncultured Croceitalea sp. TaxID=1798908 RepID=UPI00374F9DE2
MIHYLREIIDSYTGNVDIERAKNRILGLLEQSVLTIDETRNNPSDPKYKYTIRGFKKELNILLSKL